MDRNINQAIEDQMGASGGYDYSPLVLLNVRHLKHKLSVGIGGAAPYS
ncbi:hypothetical protein [Methanobrevibacter ruminantium]|nr:hypothetical protein [Methanobrevibacter ruminantium]